MKKSIYKTGLFTATLILSLSARAQNITTIAGDGTMTSAGDGGPATAASFYYPMGVATDATGNVFVADMMGKKFRKINTSGIITTVAGGGTKVLIDGVPATDEWFSRATAIAVDNAGNMYVCDYQISDVWKINTSGIINRIAGKGTIAFSGDNGPATDAELDSPTGVAVDAAGNVYIADSWNNRIRKINTAGIITTVAGNGAGTYTGDGGPATAASLQTPMGVAVDLSGNIYIADKYNYVIRKVNTSGIISTFAGGGSGGSGVPATAADIGWPENVATDASGNVYIVNSAAAFKVNTSGTIYHIAGSGGGFGGDGGPATACLFDGVVAVAADSKQNVYISDQQNNRIRKINYEALSANTAVKAVPSVMLFPNPAATKLDITSSECISKVCITDMIGQSVFAERYNAREVSIDVSALPAGIYMARINDTEVRKFVKQ
jgi:sugar lactone lactonase YvrE